MKDSGSTQERTASDWAAELDQIEARRAKWLANEPNSDGTRTLFVWDEGVDRRREHVEEVLAEVAELEAMIRD